MRSLEKDQNDNSFFGFFVQHNSYGNIILAHRLVTLADIYNHLVINTRNLSIVLPLSRLGALVDLVGNLTPRQRCEVRMAVQKAIPELKKIVTPGPKNGIVN